MYQTLLEVLQIGGDTVNAAVTGTAANLAVPNQYTPAQSTTRKGKFFRALVVGTETVFARDAVQGAATTANGMPIRPDEPVLLNLSGVANLSLIAGGAGSTLYLTPLANE